MMIKKMLLLIRVLYYKIRGRKIKIGRNVNVHPSAKLATYRDSSITIGNDGALAGLTIIRAEGSGKVELSDNVSLSRGVQIYSRNSISIGEGTMIGNNSVIVQPRAEKMCTFRLEGE